MGLQLRQLNCTFLFRKKSFCQYFLQKKQIMTLSDIKSAIESGNVVVVSKGYCPFCKRAKAIVEGCGIDSSKINIFEIENDPNMQAIQAYMGKVTGGTTVPRIFIGGKFVGGCDEITKLHSSGKLREMLAAC